LYTIDFFGLASMAFAQKTVLGRELQLYPGCITVSSANSDYLRKVNRWTDLGSGSGIANIEFAKFDVSPLLI